MAPNMYLYQRPTTAPRRMQRALPDAIDLLTISVESGLGFDAAVAQVARNTEGPLAEEFARMLQEMQIGRGRADALRSMAERTDLPDLRSFVSAMVQADAFGIPVGQVLRVQSSEIRVKSRQWAEEMAQKVPVKILVPLIFCILPCLFIAVLGPAGIYDHGQLLRQGCDPDGDRPRPGRARGPGLHHRGPDRAGRAGGSRLPPGALGPGLTVAGRGRSSRLVPRPCPSWLVALVEGCVVAAGRGLVPLRRHASRRTWSSRR